MAFELLILLLIAVCVYFRLIPNDLLILAFGIVVRGALTAIPSIAALNANTSATQQNTVVTSSTTASKGDTTKAIMD